MKYQIGITYIVKYPFIKTTFSFYEGSKTPTWKPGIEYRYACPQAEAEPYADGRGYQCIKVISKHKPPGFPERIFYTRTWIDPDGKEFGKNQCRVKTTGNITKILNGFQYEYLIEPGV